MTSDWMKHYPYSVRDLADRKGCSHTSIYNAIQSKRLTINPADFTTIGMEKFYSEEFLQKLLSFPGLKGRKRPTFVRKAHSRHIERNGITFHIQKNFEFPKKVFVSRFPVDELDVGEGFIVGHEDYERLRSAVSTLKKSYPDRKLTVRHLSDGSAAVKREI